VNWTGSIEMKNMIKEQAYREEAERLALLPVADQHEIVALHRSVAANPKVPKGDRNAARELAEALERLLKLAPKTRKRH